MRKKEYVDFLDHFDGGGAGRTGNSFEGGGLLSALANIFATPYGSEDRSRRAQRRQALGLLDTAAAPARAPAPFAPRTAPLQQIPSHLTGPKMGMPPPVVPSHLTGPKMGMPPPEMQYPWQADARFVQMMQQDLLSDPNLEYVKNDPQRMQNIYEVYLRYTQQ